MSITGAIAATMALVAVASSCSSPSGEELIGYVPPSTKNVAEASITDAATGEPFRFVAPEGELLIGYFGYTHCPDVCPTTLVALRNAEKSIGSLADRVTLAMATVDPDRDTVDVLPRYLGSLSDGFHALIPTSTDELRAAERLFQTTSSVTVVGDRVEVVHGATAYVIDDIGDVLVEWPFGIDSESMANDLRILLNKKETTQ